MLTLERVKGGAMPSIIEAEPAHIDDLLYTPEDLARRWQCDTATLANARSRGEGVPWLKVTGGVRYRLADIINHEQAKSRGFTWAKLAGALDTWPGLSRLQKQELLAHLKAKLE